MERRERSKGTGSLFKRVASGPWIAAYVDWNGKRVVRSTRTTDRQAAERVLSKLVADAALRREGVIDPMLDRFAVAGRQSLASHADAYLTHCGRAGLARQHLDSKRRHLKRLAEVTGILRLNELTPDALELYLASIKHAGRSPRSVNFARQLIVTFVSWCVKTGRVGSNALKAIPRQDERHDRRRVRRPLTDQELQQLLFVARERGREAWYLCCVLAGLRRGDLIALKWSDINFADRTLTIRTGKARRVDVLAIHPQLHAALKALHGRAAVHERAPTARVFPQAVTNVTRIRDFLRAGIYRLEPVLDHQGQQVFMGEGKRRRPQTRIVTVDPDGRIADLHALRTTLGTNLARAGVTPQVAQKIMRHSDYRTTLAHYTVLGLSDTARAIAALPTITVAEPDAAPLPLSA